MYIETRNIQEKLVPL